MSRPLSGRLAATLLLRRAGISHPKTAFQIARPWSHSSTRWSDRNGSGSGSPLDGSSRSNPQSQSPSPLQSIYGSSRTASNAQDGPSSAMATLSQSLASQAFNKSSVDTSALTGKVDVGKGSAASTDVLEPFHFHVYAHKHNTHVTCTKPDRKAIVSLSCGNLGYRNARRGTFDAAYSLTKYVLERLIHTGWPPKIKRLEVVLRGFGKGREAAIKVLMSPEGKLLREKIVRVADATRIKYAGTRSRKPRRL